MYTEEDLKKQHKNPSKSGVLIKLTAKILALPTAIIFAGLYVSDFFSIFSMDIAIALAASIGIPTALVYFFILGDGWKDILEDSKKLWGKFKGLFSKNPAPVGVKEDYEEDNSLSQKILRWLRKLSPYILPSTVLLLSFIFFIGFRGLFADNGWTGIAAEYIVPSIIAVFALIAQSVFYVKFIFDKEKSNFELANWQKNLKYLFMTLAVISGIGLSLAAVISLTEASFLNFDAKISIAVLLGIGTFIGIIWQNVIATKNWIVHQYEIYAQIKDLNTAQKIHFFLKNAGKGIASVIPAAAEVLFVSFIIAGYIFGKFGSGLDVLAPLVAGLAIIGLGSLVSNFAEEHDALVNNKRIMGEGNNDKIVEIEDSRVVYNNEKKAVIWSNFFRPWTNIQLDEEGKRVASSNSNKP